MPFLEKERHQEKGRSAAPYQMTGQASWMQVSAGLVPPRTDAEAGEGELTLGTATAMFLRWGAPAGRGGSSGRGSSGGGGGRPGRGEGGTLRGRALRRRSEILKCGQLALRLRMRWREPHQPVPMIGTGWRIQVPLPGMPIDIKAALLPGSWPGQRLGQLPLPRRGWAAHRFGYHQLSTSRICQQQS
jgi:hypothetical protein